MISALNVCIVEYDEVFSANLPIVDIDKKSKSLENTLFVCADVKILKLWSYQEFFKSDG